MREVYVGGGVTAADDLEGFVHWYDQVRGSVRYYVILHKRFVRVECYEHPVGGLVWSVLFRAESHDKVFASGGSYMALKYIRAAAAVAAGEECCGPTTDPLLFAGRPALAEYMSAVLGPGGTAREPSVLMVGLFPDGVRVGLKDEDAGGWLWRQADSLKKGLDAIEKALADGSAKFSGPRGRKVKGK